jgi:hypothetical protein
MEEEADQEDDGMVAADCEDRPDMLSPSSHQTAVRLDQPTTPGIPKRRLNQILVNKWASGEQSMLEVSREVVIEGKLSC